MTEIHSGAQTKAVAKFCPKCGGSDVTVTSSFSGQSASVKCACGWLGTVEELIVTQFKHGFANDEQILQQMVTDLRNLLAKEFAKTFGAFLRKWGFLPADVTPLYLSRYVVAVAKATMQAIIETRQEIEKERSDGRGQR